MNCPLIEQTANGTPVGRCCFHLPDGKTCPRHGDVFPEVERFNREGRMTIENAQRLRLGKPLLGSPY